MSRGGDRHELEPRGKVAPYPQLLVAGANSEAGCQQPRCRQRRYRTPDSAASVSDPLQRRSIAETAIRCGCLLCGSAAEPGDTGLDTARCAPGDGPWVGPIDQPEVAGL